MVGASNDVFLVVLWVVVVRIGQDLLLWLFFLGIFGKRTILVIGIFVLGMQVDDDFSTFRFFFGFFMQRQLK